MMKPCMAGIPIVGSLYVVFVIKAWASALLVSMVRASQGLQLWNE